MNRAQELRRLIERLKVLRSNSRVPSAKATLDEAIVVVAAALARCEQEQGGDFPSEAFV